MSAVLGEAKIRVGADTTGFKSGLQQSANGAGAAGTRAAGQFSTAFNKHAKRALAIGGLAVAGVATKALVGGFKRLEAIDQAKAKLTGLGHSAESVKKIMDNALTSVKGTAFGLGDAASLAATMVASGVKPGQELERTLKLVGDAATISGSSLSDMGLIFSKVAAANKIQAEEMNQLTERSIPIMQLLGDSMGKTREQVLELSKDGKISFANFQKAIEKGMGGAALDSGKTFTGALKNVGAALGRFGANVLGKAFEGMKPVFADLVTELDNMGPAAEEFGEIAGNALLGVAKALPPVVSGTATLMRDITTGTGTVGLFADGLRGIAGGLGVIPAPVVKFGAALLVTSMLMKKFGPLLATATLRAKTFAASMSASAYSMAFYGKMSAGTVAALKQGGLMVGMVALTDGATKASTAIGALEMTAGGALIGLAAGGPAGAAAGAALGAVGSAALSLRNDYKAVTVAAEDFNRALSTSALKADEEFTKLTAARDKLKSGFWFKLGQSDLGALSPLLRTVTDNLNASSTAAVNKAAADRFMANAASTAATQERLLAQGAQLSKQGLEAAAGGAQKFHTALQVLMGNLSKRDALLNAKRATTQLAESFKQNGTQLRGMSAAAMSNNAAVNDMARSYITAADQILQTGGSASDAAAKLGQGRREFIRIATAAGMGGKKARQLANDLGLIPATVNSKVKVDTGNAKNDLNTFMNQVDAATRARNLIINIQKAGAVGLLVPGSADGGTVGGARRPYGDKVLMALAPGEEVISNRHGQADKHRPLLKAINGGLADGGTVPGLAKGGTVKKGKKGKRGGGGGGPDSQFFNVPREVTRQVSQSFAADISDITGQLLAQLSDQMTSIAENMEDQGEGAAAGIARSYVAKFRPWVTQLGKTRELLESATAKLDELKQGLQSTLENVRRTLSDTSKIATMRSFKGMIRTMTARDKSTGEYADALRQLEHMGLNRTLFQQITDAGISGLGAAKAIIQSGAAGVAQLNALQTGVEASADRAAATAGDYLYAAGIASAQGVVDGLKAQEAQILAIMGGIGVQLGNEIAASIDATGGGLRSSRGGGGGGGKGKKGKKPKKHAIGSISTSGLALVGERGPEYVNLPRGSRVYSNRESKQMMEPRTINAPVTLNQNFYGPTTSGGRLREIHWTLRYATIARAEKVEGVAS